MCPEREGRRVPLRYERTGSNFPPSFDKMVGAPH